MPRLQVFVPQEIADAIQREADSRIPPGSVSRVTAEAVVKAFKNRVCKPKTQKSTRH